MLLRSLPVQFDGLVTALDNVPGELTIETAKLRIMDESNRLKDRKGENTGSEKAMYSHARKSYKKSVCNYCKKPGHFQKDCFKLKRDHKEKETKQKGVEARQAKEQCFTTCVRAMSGSRNSWCVDSGSSNHMTNDRHFCSKLDVSVRVKIWLANGSTITSAGIGEGFLKCYDGDGNINTIPVKDVLFAPDLDGGLLSVRKLAERGWKVVFDDARCNIISANGKIAAVAESYGDIYKLNMVETAKVCVDSHHLPNCQHIWHRRMGHRHPGVLERVKQEGLSKGLNIQECGIKEVCEYCLRGKLTRISFPKTAQNRTKRILDLVHTDVCGQC